MNEMTPGCASAVRDEAPLDATGGDTLGKQASKSSFCGSNHIGRNTLVAREKTQRLIHKIETGMILCEWVARIFPLATGVICQV